MTARPTMRQVLEQLSREGLLEAGAEPAIRTALSAEGDREKATPWFVRVLIGLGAWVATPLFVVFLMVTRIVDSSTAAVVLGFVFTGTGAGLRRVSRTVFLQQLALALALSGEVLLIAGFAHNGHEQSVAAMVLVVELTMLALYPEAVHRFLSTLACAGAAAVLVSRVQSPIGSDAYVVALAIAAGLALVWQPSAAVRWWTWLPGPVGHALVLSLFTALLARFSGGPAAAGTPFDFARELDFLYSGTDSPLAAIGLCLGLLALEEILLSEIGLSPTHPAALVTIAFTLLVGILTARTPGILAALGVLALGFRGRRPLLAGPAVAFLVVFMGLYYYSLSVSLLAKSGVLAGSGLVLLAAWFLLSRSAPAVARRET